MNPYFSLPEDLLEGEIAAICSHYRITPTEVKTLFTQYLRQRPDLLKKIPADAISQEILRLRAYKNLIKTVRKQVYYHLRQYQPDKVQSEQLRQQLAQVVKMGADPHGVQAVIQQILRTHVSTKERAEMYSTFYKTLFDLMPAPRTILDIGCGIHPISYPFTQPEYRPEIYVAIDQQPDVIETLTVFAPYAVPTRLLPFCRDIADLNWQALPEITTTTFDLAFMLKLIPVIARQQRALLPKLANAPACVMLITASTEAMTRKTSIRRREDRLLQEFIALTGREVLASVQFGNEFGYVLGQRC